MIVAVAGQKGGAGKSTLAICVAVELQARGRRVLLVDADPQGTTVTWRDVAAESGHDTPAVVAMGDALRRDLPSVARDYDATVIDCPGRAASKRTTGALLVSDVVLLPCGPAAPDVWALAESVDVVREVQALRPELRAAIVLNKVDRTAMSKQARAALADVGLPVFKQALGSRVAFAESLAAGMGVTRYAAGGVAANELRRVVDELELFTGGTDDA